MEAKYKILVVDDELPIREELQLFEFGKLQCVICGQAENGHQALAFIKSNPVDIVITDIRMPVMDGLQLIEKTKELFPDIQIILLSCINDFEPIKLALKLGVVDYILKGAYSDNELEAATLKAVSNIEERNKNRIDHQKDGYWNAVRLLSRLVHRDEALSEVAIGRLRELGVLGEYPLTVAWINFRVNTDEAAALVDELRAQYISSPDFIEGTRIYFILPGGCLIFRNPASKDSAEPLSALDGKRHMVDHLYQKTRFHSGEKTACSNYFVPKPVRSDRDLAGVLFKIEAFHDSGFYIDQGAICEDALICRSLHDVDVEELRMDFTSVPVETSTRFLKGDFRTFMLLHRIHKSELFDFVSRQLRNYLSCRLKATGATETFPGIYASRSLDELIDEVIAWLTDLPSGKKLHKHITHAMQFINQDLSKPMSLSIVAEKIGISTSYLSSLFCRETGKQFNEYITEKRMEKAADLLRESSYKVYEVAQMVGIPSYRYFSKLFKEYTGQIARDFK